MSTTLVDGKAFQTFKIGGIQFLAFIIPGNEGVTVVDENRNNYGSYMTLENFRKYHSKGEATPLGKMAITGMILPS